MDAVWIVFISIALVMFAVCFVFELSVHARLRSIGLPYRAGVDPVLYRSPHFWIYTAILILQPFVVQGLFWLFYGLSLCSWPYILLGIALTVVIILFGVPFQRKLRTLAQSDAGRVDEEIVSWEGVGFYDDAGNYHAPQWWAQGGYLVDYVLLSYLGVLYRYTVGTFSSLAYIMMFQWILLIACYV